MVEKRKPERPTAALEWLKSDAQGVCERSEKLQK